VRDRLVVLGIDPGTIVTGLGVVALDEKGMRAVWWGSVRTSPDAPLAQRLAQIHTEIVAQIGRFHPDHVAVENVFQARNVGAALKLGHARGVALLAAAAAGLPIYEYAPREVKKSVVGIGSATKEQVASMVGRLLGLAGAEILEDESDAVAVALCHIHKTARAVVA